MYFQNNYRSQRVAQEIHRKISVILQHNINDINIDIPTISGVTVSKDLKYANVFVTFFNKNNLEEANNSIIRLQRAARCIRFLLAKILYLRVMPVLFFKYDNSLIEGARICNLIINTKQPITITQKKKKNKIDFSEFKDIKIF
ncbi:30S ribosome-binding factor RbfA [Candidatus Blochmannia ocreatus (nom. nud.)]|uniref:Ribosome-binding factor A n=1 Tax=Candidatus Blochmannia ocreatus (nom. nud.) TaxID=251538 RepID=A0ABY4SZC4_9ENTR|nr:30S ribosome-binding factor RbfA [Candidatus Blochmannia ocreatus]URJ25189.1 30S ribosome-binding factor RbfA [Candidatus Blochmannia ocreatus]